MRALDRSRKLLKKSWVKVRHPELSLLPLSNESDGGMPIDMQMKTLPQCI